MFQKTIKYLRNLFIIALISGLSAFVFTSCGTSNYGCYYDLSKYQKSKRPKRGASSINVPESFEHKSPVRKKWIIRNKRLPSHR